MSKYYEHGCFIAAFGKKRNFFFISSVIQSIQSRVQKKNLLPVVKDCDNQLMKPIEFGKLEFISFSFTYFKVTFSRFKSRNRDYNTFQRKIGTYTFSLFFFYIIQRHSMMTTTQSTLLFGHGLQKAVEKREPKKKDK